MTASWFVLGAGYTGARLAQVLVGRGFDVTVTRRDRDEAAALAAEVGARGLRVELADPATVVGVIPPGAIVVDLAPPGMQPAEEIAALLAGAEHARRIVYVSSTGVYPAAGGAWVDESWPLDPITPSGRARVTAEAALATGPVPAIALRAAGIHGPGRGLVERIKAGTYRIVGDGRAHVSRIHVDDLVEAIVRAGLCELTGAVNVADDDPAPIGEVADTLAAHFGLPPPPRVPVDSVSREIAGMLTADRRIANARLKGELGVALTYPSWRSALR